MRPSQVLDMQADLHMRLQDTTFQSIARNTFSADMGSALVKTEHEKERVRGNAASIVHQTLPTHVRLAYAYRVTDDMSALVQHAATQLDETDLFDPRLAPSEAGIVRFDRPLPVIDVRGRTMKAHWLLWGPIGVIQGGAPGQHTLMTWFNDSHDPDDVDESGYPPKALAALGRWRWVGADHRGRMSPLGARTVPIDEDYAELVRAEGDEPTPASNCLRYVHALWLLLGQTITSVTEDPLDRHARRKAAKMRLPGRVSVIALRRSDNSARMEGESMVEWRHRWLVRRHWRWQPYGPRKGAAHDGKPGSHVYGLAEPGEGTLVQRCLAPGCDNYLARIIIEGYHKGPADKPLIITEKVMDLRR